MVFVIPALFIVGVYLGGWWTYSSVIFAFGIIPALEVLFRPNPRNLDKLEKEMLREDKKYDYLLYLVVPITYSCIAIFLFSLNNYAYSTFEYIGLIFSLGVVLGGLGINVAHELGHRPTKFEQLLAKALLLPSAYMHFFIEHNYGHHKNVSTFEDPASARYNESVYMFWLRSVIFSYLSAWKIEKKRLERKKQKVISLQNGMVRFTIITILFYILIFTFFGWFAFLLFVASSVFGFLLLETVNYIEHYGLSRRKINENRYEKVSPIHSWNSNHIIGRIMLFELSRHSDHHYKPTKKYQLLDHHENSPQMPTGYPGMMLLSLIPPLWFAIMNKRIPKQFITE
jgi:alkane 1-monooxygenase